MQNSKGLYKKSVLHMQICFLLIRSIDLVAFLMAVAVKHYTISLFVYKYLVNESFAFSRG